MITCGTEQYETGIDPLRSWGLSGDKLKFYRFMLDAKDRTFYFRDRRHLLNFIEEQKGVFTGTTRISDQSLLQYYDEIVRAEFSSLEKRDTSWCAKIVVLTRKGHSQTVNVFCSVKRHLISSFMRSQISPRDSKVMNVVVKDDLLFERKLIEYATFHAARIAKNRMLFGYNPERASAEHTDAELKFGTDTTLIPSTGWTYDNPIHAFPEGGNATKSLTQEQYAAVVTFLLWFFRTEEHLAEGLRFNKIQRLVGESKDQEEKNVALALQRAKTSLKTFQDSYSVKFPVVDVSTLPSPETLDDKFTALKDKKNAHYKQLLMTIGLNLNNVLVTQGHVPAIDRPYIAAKDKDAGIKAAYQEQPDVRFKTHKIEVRAKIPNLPPELITWAIEGHTTVGADDIIQSISSENSTKQHVKAQIREAEGELKTLLSTPEDAMKKVNQLVQEATNVNILP